jgi:hypothetical protein
MGLQHAATFRYAAYQSEILALVEQVDRGNFEPLRRAVVEAIPQLAQGYPLESGWTSYDKPISVQTWSLFEHGLSDLPDAQEFENIPSPSNYELGLWFFFLAGKYATPCPSLYGNWGVLWHVLHHSGWSITDCDLLVRGFPAFKLLKPDLVAEQPKFLPLTAPYFFCVDSGRSNSGWLPTQEIERLLPQLDDAEHAVKAFDARDIPWINVDNPVVIREFDDYISVGYKSALEMLAAAKRAEQGLFMSITLP